MSMGIAQEICNKVMSEVQGIKDTGFPLDAFPEKVQTIILDMVRYENFKVEYLAPAMLSAVSSALGGTCYVRVKGQWMTNAALYIIMVGRPGLGKTPPLEAAFRPIRRNDNEKMEKFKADMAAYQNAAKESKGDCGMEKPMLSRTLVSDFTPEALLLAHYSSPRGITILVDEIMGMFNSANRYNNGQLIEQLLTAWSGGALDVVRVNNPIPLHIEHPCINMIGTTQTKRMGELMKKGYEENGLLDRILFTLPKVQQLTLWTEGEDEDIHRRSATAIETWQGIIDKVLDLNDDTISGTNERKFHLIDMEPQARSPFFAWHNATIQRKNAILDENMIDSRPMKAPVHVSLIALVLQVLRYACGESHLRFVTEQAIHGAIRMMEYFEDSYCRIREYVANDACDEPSRELLSMLNNSFSTAEALAAGKQLNVTDRTVMNYLKELSKNRLVRKIKQGEYRKNSFEGFPVVSTEEKTETNCNE